MSLFRRKFLIIFVPALQLSLQVNQWKCEITARDTMYTKRDVTSTKSQRYNHNNLSTAEWYFDPQLEYAAKVHTYNVLKQCTEARQV